MGEVDDTYHRREASSCHREYQREDRREDRYRQSGLMIGRCSTSWLTMTSKGLVLELVLVGMVVVVLVGTVGMVVGQVVQEGGMVVVVQEGRVGTLVDLQEGGLVGRLEDQTEGEMEYRR